MTLPYLPGVGDELAAAIGPQSGFLQGLRTALNPNYDAQVELKKELIKDPTLRQKLIDEEAKNPGTLDTMFGKGASVLGMGSPSTNAMQEIYDRQNLNKPLDQVAAQGTPQSEKLLKDTSGVNASERQYYKYRNVVAKGEADAAPAKSALEEAKAKMDLHLLPAQAEEAAAQIADKAKQRTLVTGLLTTYKGPKGVVNAMMSGNMPEDARRAAFQDEGLYRQYNEEQQNRRLDLEAARDRAKEQRDRDSISDRLDMNDAENKANLAARYGNSVKSKDLFLIKKAGLEGKMDEVSNMSHDQAVELAKTDPVVAQIINSPTMLVSWNQWKKTQQEVDDKDVATMRGEYNKAINTLRADVAAKKRGDEEINNRIIDIMNLPYYDIMKARGTPLPTISWSKKGALSRHEIRFTYPNGQEATSPDKPAPLGNKEKADRYEALKKKYPNLSPAALQAMVEAGKQ